MRFIEETDDDTERDFPRERKITQDGKTAVIYAVDPHGFWKAKLEKTKTQPKVFEGVFTGIHEAEKAVLAYFNAQKTITILA